MASSPTDLPPRYFTAADGVRLAWRETGAGRPLVLIHGLFSDAWVNWIRYGHAGAIAARGFRVIMPDLRGHGLSDKPHDAAAYPPDVLASDSEALLRHLDLGDFDLGGYSLGARTTVRMLVRGARPRRIVLAGMGLAGLTDTGHRAEHFRRVLASPDSFARGTAEWMVSAFLKTTNGDPAALLPLLDSFVDTPLDEIARIDRPTLVLSGAEDADNGSAAALAEVLPDARYAEVPGNHMSAVLGAGLGIGIAGFLAA